MNLKGYLSNFFRIESSLMRALAYFKWTLVNFKWAFLTLKWSLLSLKRAFSIPEPALRRSVSCFETKKASGCVSHWLWPALPRPLGVRRESSSHGVQMRPPSGPGAIENGGPTGMWNCSRCEQSRRAERRGWVGGAFLTTAEPPALRGLVLSQRDKTHPVPRRYKKMRDRRK